jgi:cell division protein FtsW
MEQIQNFNRLQTTILLIVFMLLAVGFVMVYSTSAIVAQMDPATGNAMFFVKKQAMWIMLAVAAMLLCLEIPYQFLSRYGYWIFGFAVLLLVLVLVPGIGTKYNGARRWIRVAGMGFQPSDFMKLAIVILLAKYVQENYDRLHLFWRGFLPVFAAVGVAGGLVLIEPDFGTALFLMLLALSLLFIAGIRMRHLLPVLIAGLPAFALFAWYKFQHIHSRILTYLNPDFDPLGKGYQIRQALIALGSGGDFGVGLGLSKQKLFFLSEESTDFIFAIIGEELGLLGCSLIVLLYVLLLYYGLQVALRSGDISGKITALGITLAITMQAMFNIAVVTHTIPAKGISLPLISFGGSGIFFTMIGVGILLNIAGHTSDST